MARRTNSITAVISALTAALRLESIPNPSAEQLEQIHQAKVKAADIADDSNFVTMGENADEAIEAQHQADEARAAEEAAEEVAEADEEARRIEDADEGPDDDDDEARPPLAQLAEQTE